MANSSIYMAVLRQRTSTSTYFLILTKNGISRNKTHKIIKLIKKFMKLSLKQKNCKNSG